MNNHTHEKHTREKEATFDQVIEAYLLRCDDAAKPSRAEAFHARATHDILTEFMRRYPNHADELMNYAATASIVEHLSATQADAAQETAIVKRGMEIFSDLLATQSTAIQGDAPLTSLCATAEAQGLTLPVFAAQTNLSILVLLKLERRLIRFASIPHAAIERIARTINQTHEAVAIYLQGERKFAPAAANFLAKETPQMPEAIDFYEAIEKDLMMNDSQKQMWRQMRDEV